AIVAPNENRDTILHLLAREPLPHGEIFVQYVFSQLQKDPYFNVGAFIDALNGRHETALYIAMSSGYRTLLELFVQFGGNQDYHGASDLTERNSLRPIIAEPQVTYLPDPDERVEVALSRTDSDVALALDVPLIQEELHLRGLQWEVAARSWDAYFEAVNRDRVAATMTTCTTTRQSTCIAGTKRRADGSPEDEPSATRSMTELNQPPGDDLL
ncbi:MAG TPA: hypothetical protein PLV25_05385, partial [Opitutales bacterium]|nr:hypothetical protein [Opitutales bacterium]